MCCIQTLNTGSSSQRDRQELLVRFYLMFVCLIDGIELHFQQYFSYIVAVLFELYVFVKFISIEFQCC